MKTLFLTIAVLFSLALFGQKDVIPEPPKPMRLVNDFAGLLTPEQRDHLEEKLVAYDDTTSSQIAVVTMKNLGGYAASQYATELGEKWGVGGSAQFDNGIVILVSTGDDTEKRQAFIAVGRGLEGAIPDITAGHIFEEYLVPEMQAGNFYRAFDQATSALMQAAAGEYELPPGYAKRKKGRGVGVGKIIVAIFVIIMLIASMFGGGRPGGGYMSRRGYRGFGGPVIFPGGLGGSRGGGFGSGGGGFGGFGGGSFGGGGAGGSW